LCLSRKHPLGIAEVESASEALVSAVVIAVRLFGPVLWVVTAIVVHGSDTSAVRVTSVGA
jgi:hypothetical protein